MFTGIVEGKGLLKKIESSKTHTRMELQSSFSLKGTKLGDSIAVNGCCLTVTKIRGNNFSADISPETLRCTTLRDFKKGMKVNLERPLRLGDRLGGHLVQGHVDGIGKIVSMKLMKAQPESFYLVEIKIPKHLKPYMVEKGSITVDGISLTINQVKDDKISLCIIPHTQEKTTLTAQKVGAKVNLEADILLKYIEKISSSRRSLRSK
jgi:riboflavin synthase